MYMRSNWLQLWHALVRLEEVGNLADSRDFDDDHRRLVVGGFSYPLALEVLDHPHLPTYRRVE